MKTYAIIGNKYEGLYTKPWSIVKEYIKIKPTPKYRGFLTLDEAKSWFDSQKSYEHLSSHNYIIAYDGEFPIYSGKYYIFIDGGSRNTGNISGGHVKNMDKSAWAIAIYRGDDLKTPIFKDAGAFFGRTNNEMEILAFIHGLKQAQKVKKSVVIISDSKYVLNVATNWIYDWELAGWKKNNGQIANLKLWKQVYQLIKSVGYRLEFIWVKGHANSIGNVLVDKLLNQAMDQL